MAKSIISGVMVMQQNFLSHFLQINADPTRESFATLNSSSWIIFTGFSFFCNLFYVTFPFFLRGGVRRKTENCEHKLISSLARDYLGWLEKGEQRLRCNLITLIVHKYTLRPYHHRTEQCEASRVADTAAATRTRVKSLQGLFFIIMSL